MRYELENLQAEAASSAVRVDELDLLLHRASADKNIIALNLSSAVNQALTMMAQRDEAKLEVDLARQEAAVALEELNAVKQEVKSLQMQVSADKAALASAEANRDAALKAQKRAEEEVLLLKEQAKARSGFELRVIQHNLSSSHLLLFSYAFSGRLSFFLTLSLRRLRWLFRSALCVCALRWHWRCVAESLPGQHLKLPLPIPTDTGFQRVCCLTSRKPWLPEKFSSRTKRGSWALLSKPWKMG